VVTLMFVVQMKQAMGDIVEIGQHEKQGRFPWLMVDQGGRRPGIVVRQ
jgi:hypothetical protein